MAKAKKLPSGSWRCLVYDYTDADGKRKYKSSKKNSFKSLMNKNIFDITQEDVQNEINKISEKASPKTVRNKHGMISAVLKLCNIKCNTK